jgi:hypothetical protein
VLVEMGLNACGDRSCRRIRRIAHLLNFTAS